MNRSDYGLTGREKKAGVSKENPRIDHEGLPGLELVMLVQQPDNQSLPHIDGSSTITDDLIFSKRYPLGAMPSAGAKPT